MSCDVAAAAFLFLAAAGGAAPTPVSRPAVISVAKEPLYAEIVGRAGRLKADVEAYRLAGAIPRMETFAAAVTQLSDLDMKGQWDPLESTCRHASLSIL